MRQRIAGMCDIRDRARKLLAAQLDDVGDNALATLRRGLNGSYDGNDTQNFFIPEIGYVQQINPQFAAGVAVYGNGGMNTDYGSNPFRAFGANIVRLNSESAPSANRAAFVLRLAVWCPETKAAACMATVANTASQMNLKCHWQAVS